MKAFEKILYKNIKKNKDLEYYKLHIFKIRQNVVQNPDIAIEMCKSLIEGVSKTILTVLDKTYDEKKLTSGRGAKSVQQFFKMALEQIADKNENFEVSFIHSSANIINVVSHIRTERGDVSHGKSIPKKNNSDYRFSILVSQITDTILAYVLTHFFEIDLSYLEHLNYDSEEMEAYNNWLDESVEFPIEKVAYSKVLFEHDYISYENRYNDEYLTRDEEINKEEKQLDGEETINQSIDKGEKAYNSCKDSEKHNESNSLSTIFDSATYWTENKMNLLISFSKDEFLDFEGLKLAINDYKLTFYFKRDDLVQIMLKTPSLKERGKVVNDLEVKIKDLITKLDLE